MRRACAVCGTIRYVPGWVIRDTARNSGAYCSRACKNTALTGRELVQGSTYVTKTGYRYVKVGIRQRKLEHRIVMEQFLGRPLGRREEVHHVNGDKLDNRPENLLVLSPSEHQKHHPEFGSRMRRRLSFTCQGCGATYERKASRAAETKFCSRSCASRAIGLLNRRS